MANVLDRLDPDDRALALVHGLTFVSRDTRGHAATVRAWSRSERPYPPERLGGVVPAFRRHPQRRRGRARLRHARSRTGPEAA